jgi:hypothetical protein
LFPHRGTSASVVHGAAQHHGRSSTPRQTLVPMQKTPAYLPVYESDWSLLYADR